MKKPQSNAYDHSTITFDQVKAILNNMYEPQVTVEVFLVRAKVRLSMPLSDFYHTAENNASVLINSGIDPDQRYLVTDSPFLDLVQVSNSEIIATIIRQPKRQTLWDAVDRVNATKGDKPARS